MIQLAVGHPALSEVAVCEGGTGEVHIVEPGATEGCTIEFHPREVLVQNGAGGEVDTLQGSDGFTFVQFITSNSFGMKEAVTVGGHRFLVGLVFGIPPRHTQWQVWQQKAIHNYQQKSADSGFRRFCFLGFLDVLDAGNLTPLLPATACDLSLDHTVPGTHGFDSIAVANVDAHVTVHPE